MGSLTEFISKVEWVPESYLMHVRHKTFGDGYVTELANDRLTCVFFDRTRVFVYPDVVNTGLIEILEDRR